MFLTVSCVKKLKRWTIAPLWFLSLVIISIPLFSIYPARTPQPHSLRPHLSCSLFVNNNTSPVPATQHIFNMLMRFTLFHKPHKPRVHSFFSKYIYFDSKVSCVNFSFPISLHYLELRVWGRLLALTGFPTNCGQWSVLTNVTQPFPGEHFPPLTNVDPEAQSSDLTCLRSQSCHMSL